MRILCRAVVPPLSPPFFDLYLSIPGVSNALSCPLSVTPLLTHICSSYQDPLFLAYSPLAISKFQLRTVSGKWTHATPLQGFPREGINLAQKSGERNRGVSLVERAKMVPLPVWKEKGCSLTFRDAQKTTEGLRLSAIERRWESHTQWPVG